MVKQLINWIVNLFKRKEKSSIDSLRERVDAMNIRKDVFEQDRRSFLRAARANPKIAKYLGKQKYKKV